jgi:prepilin-type N-terminal cleavage/methylation domain-containing protein
MLRHPSGTDNLTADTGGTQIEMISDRKFSTDHPVTGTPPTGNGRAPAVGPSGFAPRGIPTIDTRSTTFPRTRGGAGRMVAGFTIPEVLLAVVILSIGVLAMIGTSSATQRMIDRAGRTTAATRTVEAVLDSLRRTSSEGLRTCTDLAANATGYTLEGVTVGWEVDGRVAAGSAGYRVVRVMAQYHAEGRIFRDTIATMLKCDV